MSNSTSQSIRSAVQQVRMERALFLPVLPGPHGPGVGHGRLLPGTAQSKRNLTERQAPQADPDHPYGFAQLPSKGYQQSLAIIGWRYNRRPLSIALVEPRLALDRLIKPPSSDQFLTTYLQLSGRGSRDSRNLLPSRRNPELFSRPLQRTVGTGTFACRSTTSAFSAATCWRSSWTSDMGTAAGLVMIPTDSHAFVS